EEVEPWKLGNAALLHRVPPAIQHRQVDPTVVEAVAIGPYHSRYAGRLEIQRGSSVNAGIRTRRVNRVRQRFWNVHAGPAHEVVHGVLEVIGCRVGKGQVVRQIRSEHDAAVPYGDEASQQHHAVLGEVVKVEGAAAIFAGRMRVGGEPGGGRRQLINCKFEHPKGQGPEDGILAAISSWDAGGT